MFERLFDTAIRHDGMSRHIHVSSLRKDRGLVIAIEYESDGVRPEDKERLFDVQSPENRGLFIVREILSLTGITVDETGESGKTTRFEIGIADSDFRKSR